MPISMKLYYDYIKKYHRPDLVDALITIISINNSYLVYIWGHLLFIANR